jgi:hypothetical protein
MGRRWSSFDDKPRPLGQGPRCGCRALGSMGASAANMRAPNMRLHQRTAAEVAAGGAEYVAVLHPPERTPEAATWLAALRDVGYVVARGILAPVAVDELRAAFPPATPRSTLHVQVGEETPARERWLSLGEHPAVVALLRELLVDYEVWLHGREPGKGAGAQGLHADRPPGRGYDVDGITVLWMLDDFLSDNGATRVVPRSHRGAAAVPRSLAQPGVRHPDEIVVTGRAGDALIFDAHLWHSGRENVTGQRRRIVQMSAPRLSLVPGGLHPDMGRR